nr:DUF4157 domain-containing protein [Motilibacter deserti]
MNKAGARRVNNTDGATKEFVNRTYATVRTQDTKFLPWTVGDVWDEPNKRIYDHAARKRPLTLRRDGGSEGAHEQEAEQVAAAVITRAARPSSRLPVVPVRERVPPATSGVRDGRAGAPLPEDARAAAESILGVGLGHVAIHTGRAADAIVEAAGARAVTRGTDIFVAGGGVGADDDGRAAADRARARPRSPAGPCRASAGAANGDGALHGEQARRRERPRDQNQLRPAGPANRQVQEESRSRGADSEAPRHPVQADRRRGDVQVRRAHRA